MRFGDRHRRPGPDWRRIATATLARDSGLLHRRWEARRRVIVRAACVGLVAWGSYLAVASEGGVLRLWQLEREEASLSAEVLARRGELGELRDRLREPEIVRGERALREKFRLSRADEIVYFFERTDAASPAGADTSGRMDRSSRSSSESRESEGNGR